MRVECITVQGFTFLLFCFSLQANLRKSAESSISLLEKDKIMLQHRFTEYQRKADQDAEKRRNLENEGKDDGDSDTVQFKCSCKVRNAHNLIS